MGDRDNLLMRFFCAVAASLMVMACSPSYNWREVRVNDTELLGLLPCKPDTGSRVVALGGKDVEMHMTGCDVGDTTYAIASADLKDPGAVLAVLTQWRTATLANMAAERTTETPLLASATSHMPAVAVVAATGKKRDGAAVRLQGIWFARGTQVFHAAVYAAPVANTDPKSRGADSIEPFFSGLKFQ